MEFKIARSEQNAQPKKITIEKIEEMVNKSGQKIIYLDRENSHKDILALISFFETKGLGVYHRIIKYGLGDNDFMYEVHIL